MLSTRALAVCARALHQMDRLRSVTMTHMLRAARAVASTPVVTAVAAFPGERRLMSTHIPDSSPAGVSAVAGGELGAPVESFPLSPSVVAALKKAGFPTLFPVQAHTLPSVLDGEDVVVRARTGTGKTLGFVVPIVEKLVKAEAARRPIRDRRPLCLVMTPTRELALQVEGEFDKVGTSLGLKSVCIYGGASMAVQVNKLRGGCDVVVGTPGRIQDLLSQGELDLARVQFATLDEADDMLRTGFKEAVEEIYRSLPTEGVQHMLWSATVPAWVSRLARDIMNEPKFIDLVGEDAPKLPANLVNVAIPVQARDVATALKMVVRHYVNDESDYSRALVFTDRKVEASELASALHTAGGITAGVLTGDLSQAAREATLSAFREGRMRVLIATDVAARGLDIPEVDMVVHIGAPKTHEAFVHRSGRTARAGRKGTNIVLVTPRDREHFDTLKELENTLGMTFHLRPVPTMSLTSDHITAAAKTVEGISKHSHIHDDAVTAAVSQLTDKFTHEQLARMVLLQALNLPKELATFSLLTGRPGHMTLKVPFKGFGSEVLDKVYEHAGERGVHQILETGDNVFLDVSTAVGKELMSKLSLDHTNELSADESRRLRQFLKGGSGGAMGSDRHGSSSPYRKHEYGSSRFDRDRGYKRGGGEYGRSGGEFGRGGRDGGSGYKREGRGSFDEFRRDAKESFDGFRSKRPEYLDEDTPAKPWQPRRSSEYTRSSSDAGGNKFKFKKFL